MISFIVCSARESRFEPFRRHVAQVMGAEPYELVRVKDAVSMCAGYNFGLANSRGDALVFCHDDVEFLAPDVPGRLRRALGEFDVAGVAGTNRLQDAHWFTAGLEHIFGAVAHPGKASPYVLTIFGAPRRAVPHIQALDGLFIACRRSVAEAIAWDERTFRHFHHYDLDWSFRAHRAGYRMGVLLDFPMLHHSAGGFDTPEWRDSAAAFLAKHKDSLATGPSHRFRCGIIQLSSTAEIVAAVNALCLGLDDHPL